MRSEGDALHNQWLLNIGIGHTSTRVPELNDDDYVEIPSDMIITNNIIHSIFTNDINQSIIIRRIM